MLYAAGPDGTEEALVDPGMIDPSGLTVLDRWQPDLTGRLLAYQLSRGGDERSELRVMDVGTRRTVDGPIDRCRYAPVVWLPDGKAFFYVRDRRVCLHRLGTPADDDVVIRAEPRSYGLGSSHDGRWLTVSAPAGAGNDLWLADLAASPPERPGLRVVQEGADATTVPAVGRDGRLYLLTTVDAPTGRLCVADPADPGPGGWRELVGPDPEAVISDFAVLDGPGRPVLLVGRTRHAISEIDVHDPVTGERLGEVPLPGLGTAGRMSARPEGGCEVWFSYTDGVTPGGVHRYDARTGRTSLWAAAPGAVEPPEVEARRIVYVSADGTPVRMVVLARPGTGPRPAILYGYGGFGIPLTPSYSAYILPWVEAGGVFALAQVRERRRGSDERRRGSDARAVAGRPDLAEVVRPEPAVPLRDPDRLHAGPRADLRQDPRQVVADGAPGQVEPVGDLLDRGPLGGHPQDVQLPAGQRVLPGAERGDGQVGVDHLLAARDPAHARGELTGGGVLDDETARPGVQRPAQRGRRREAGEDDRPAAGEGAPQLGRGGDAVGAGQADVDQRDVGTVAQARLHHLVAVPRLPQSSSVESRATIAPRTRCMSSAIRTFITRSLPLTVTHDPSPGSLRYPLEPADYRVTRIRPEGTASADRFRPACRSTRLYFLFYWGSEWPGGCGGRDCRAQALR